MTHLTDLQCSMYVDGALSGEELAAVERQLEESPECRARVEAFRLEARMIAEAVTSESDVVVPEFTVPAFKKPAGFREFALFNIGTGLFVWLLQFLWKTLFGELFTELAMRAIAWIAPIPIPNLYELAIDIALYFSPGGDTMTEYYFGLIIAAFALAAAGWLIAARRRAAATVSAVFVAIVVTMTTFAPQEAYALEHRRSEGTVNIAADEVINDTLIVAAEGVIVDGTINGDLVAMGQKVIINGAVNGNLFTAAESVRIQGDVDGLVATAGASIDIIDSKIDGNLWAAGENVVVSSGAEVMGNAAIASEDALVAGSIERDLFAFINTIDLSGSVGEDLEAFARQINLLGEAVVNGNVRFRTKNEENLVVSPNARILGETEYLELDRDFGPRNPYATGIFYVHEVLELLAAFVAGLVLFFLFPALGAAQLGAGMEGMKTAGIGLVALVSPPIIAVIIAITLIGIPVALLGFVTWIAAVFISMIVIASVIGRMLLASTEKADSAVLTLFVGLVVVSIAVNIPGIGGVIGFLLTVVGMGLIAQMMLEYVADLGRTDEGWQE